jgi:integrase
VPVNSAGSVRGPRHVVTSGQTPVLNPAEARALLDSIDVATHAGLRDRALIMAYSFARTGAALSMTVEHVYTQNRRLWVRLREKGGKRRVSRAHHQRRRCEAVCEMRGDCSTGWSSCVWSGDGSSGPM